MTRVLLVAAIAAVAAAIAANFLLLSSAAANNEPVGQLNTHVRLPAAPHWTVRPASGHPSDEHSDD